MKKALVILGLLVSSMGVVMADEVTSPDLTPAQQVEIQSQLDKQTFRGNQSQQYNFENKNVNKQIKYDKSIKNNKYSVRNKDSSQKFDKKTGYYKGQPDIRNDRFDHKLKPQYRDFKDNRHVPHMAHYKKHNGINVHHRQPNIRNFNARNHKYDNRRAFNKPVKRR